MRAAIGLFAALAVLAGAAFCRIPRRGQTAGLYTPMPTVASDTLLRKVGTVKVKCSCKGSSKSVTIEADSCPDGVKPTCDCQGPPRRLCAKARNSRAALAADMTESMLEVSGLAFAYDGALAVRDVSLTVQPGEIVALLGANGAGKSTTVRMIAGVLRPQKGAIQFRRRDAEPDRPATSSCGAASPWCRKAGWSSRR